MGDLDYGIDVLGFTSDELAELMQPEQPEPQTDPEDFPGPLTRRLPNRLT
ncbi:hypothetical protein [Rubinisphaera italica]|nr:hypothetical protein [Rubinisphaera italica]